MKKFYFSVVIWGVYNFGKLLKGQKYFLLKGLCPLQQKIKLIQIEKSEENMVKWVTGNGRPEKP